MAAALVLATIGNGATPLLKRVGVMDHEQYETYWRVHCGERGAAFRPLGLGRRCVDAEPGPLEPQHYQRDAPYFRFVFDVERGDVPLKLGKDLFLSMFVLGSLGLVALGWTVLPGSGAWPLWALSLLVGIQTVLSFSSEPWYRTLLIFRGITFLAVALLGAWMTSARSLQIMARALVIVSVIQAAIVPLESVWGLPISGYAMALSLPNRLAGTLVNPNTLGVLAAVAVALAEAFEPENVWRRAAWVTGVVLVASAGSATGWIVLAALAVHRESVPLASPKSRAALGAAAIALMVALPHVVGRPDVYDSLVGAGGRLGALREALARGTLWRGEGLVTAAPYRDLEPQSLLSLAGASPAGNDSTLILFIHQFGIVAALLFYVALAVAWRRDVAVRPLLLALALGSLTLNMAFAFPLNFLLGLALARGFASPYRTPGSRM